MDCLFHPDATPFQRTLLGRMGCTMCRSHPQNLDGVDDVPTRAVELDAEQGMAWCPRCGGTVRA